MSHACLYSPATEHQLVLILRPAEGRRLSWHPRLGEILRWFHCQPEDGDPYQYWSRWPGIELSTIESRKPNTLTTRLPNHTTLLPPHRRLLPLLRLKADIHSVVPRRAEGWVDLRVCSSCPRLYIAVTVVINTWPRWDSNLGHFTLESGILQLDQCDTVVLGLQIRVVRHSRLLRWLARLIKPWFHVKIKIL